MSTAGAPGADGLQRLGPYAIHGRLGKGAMGVVYRAFDDRDGREVALKVMMSDLEDNHEIRERFFIEARLATELHHRNLVAVYDSGQLEGRLFMAMELLRGATLSDYLRAHPAIDLEQQLDMMIQVCQGLQVLHARRVYHRDLKPSNLFLQQNGRIKILDLGVARLADSTMTLTGAVLGTPDFMSPEQVRGEDIDERSDVFSAAAVFYFLLTRRKPFAGSDLPAVLNNVLSVDPAPIAPHEAPSTVARVVMRGLSKKREDRPPSITAVWRDLAGAWRSLADEVRRRRLALAARAEDACRRAEARRAEGAAAPSWDDVVAAHPFLRRGPDVLRRFPVPHARLDAVAGSIDAFHAAATGAGAMPAVAPALRDYGGSSEDTIVGGVTDAANAGPRRS